MSEKCMFPYPQHEVLCLSELIHRFLLLLWGTDNWGKQRQLLMKGPIGHMDTINIHC